QRTRRQGDGEPDVHPGVGGHLGRDVIFRAQVVGEQFRLRGQIVVGSRGDRQEGARLATGARPGLPSTLGGRDAGGLGQNHEREGGGSGAAAGGKILRDAATDG